MDGPALYTRQVWKGLNYLPSWPLGTDFKLGEIGTWPWQGGAFERERHLSDFGIHVVSRSEKAGDWGFASEQTKAALVDLGAKGTVGGAGVELAAAGAQVALAFAAADAVFLRVEGVVVHSIENLGEVKDKAAELDKQKRWKGDWALITHLVEIRRGIVLISGSSDAEATIRVDAEIPVSPGQLAKGGAGLSLSSHEGMAFDVVLRNKSTPLFKAQHLRWVFPKGKRFKQLRGKLRPPASEPKVKKGDLVAEFEPVPIEEGR